MKPTMGGIPNFHLHSPSTIVKSLELHHLIRLCPFYILHGDLDATVPVSSSVKFAKHLKEAGANAILYEYHFFSFLLFSFLLFSFLLFSFLLSSPLLFSPLLSSPLLSSPLLSSPLLSSPLPLFLFVYSSAFFILQRNLHYYADM
jgi:hypothetical protein